MRRTGCHRKHFSPPYIKKFAHMHRLPPGKAAAQMSCWWCVGPVKMGSSCDLRVNFSLHSQIQSSTRFKRNTFEVPLISSSRHHPTSRPLWSHLRHSWSPRLVPRAGQVPCSPAPTSSGFSALDPLPPFWLTDLPIRYCPVLIIAKPAPIHQWGHSSDFLILYWMDCWII